MKIVFGSILLANIQQIKKFIYLKIHENDNLILIKKGNLAVKNQDFEQGSKRNP